jgi:uncharacterized protein YjbI with pentapeptide repeats
MRKTERLVVGCSAAIVLVAAEAGVAAAQQPAGPLTIKERLSGKSADEQRVNDCKVPQALRTAERPAECDSGPLTVEDVIQAIRAATPASPAQLGGRDLSGLDLSNVDFKQADLSNAKLFGAKLVGANLSGANLSGANLDAAWLMRANFKGANLARASLFGPVVYPGLDVLPAEAPNFESADLSGARIVARLSRVNMRGCNLSGARMGVDMRNQPMGQMRADLSGSDLAGANLAGADLNRAVITFARLTDASLAQTNLFRADLSGADLSRADVTGADLTEADLYGAIMKEARGLDEAVGLDKARNRDKIIQ